MTDIFCGKCNKICYGEALQARGDYFHQDCFKCKACLKDLMTNGFYNYENEFYCSRDYQKLFGVKCTACGQFIEGDAISILDETFHEGCFVCARCNKPFPPGVNVNLIGDDYICDDCIQPANNEIPNGSVHGSPSWNLVNNPDTEVNWDGVPYCEQDYQDEFGVTCAGCGGYITGKVLQAGEKHYHPQCSRCARCGEMFGEGEEMYLQGSEIWHPDCSDEYQREIEAEEHDRLEFEQAERDRERQKIEEEERYAREMAERERAEKERVERELAERERVERERAERERIERGRVETERLEREKAAKERAERERAERERIERERERIERERADREKAERERMERDRVERMEREKAERERMEREREEREFMEREREERERVERERAERERIERDRMEREKAEREREIRLEVEREQQERVREEQARQQKLYSERVSPRDPPARGPSPAAFSAKPFGTQKTTPSSITINFKPKTTVSSTEKWKAPEIKPYEPSKTTPIYRTGQFSRPDEPSKEYEPSNPETTTVTIEDRTYNVRLGRERSTSPPASKDQTPVFTNGYNKASSISSEEGAPARPPPPPTRGSSQNWQSRMGTNPYVLDRTISPTSPRSNAFPQVDEKIDVRSANRPLSYIESATRRSDSSQPDQKASISVKSGSKTAEDAPVPNAIYRRLPNRDRDALRENRKSLPSMGNYMNDSDQARGFGSRNDANAYHRRSLPAIDREEDKPIRAAMTYPYDILKSNNYKMPKNIDKSRLETYLSDEDFQSIFKVDRENFYKQPVWKQRDMKKRVNLF